MKNYMKKPPEGGFELMYSDQSPNDSLAGTVTFAS